MTPHRLRVGVLASGAGTNLQAILDHVHGLEADVVAVGSDKPGAQALGRALALGIATREFPRAPSTPTARRATSRSPSGWSSTTSSWSCSRATCSCVSAAFLAAFPLRVINVHPALLPAFPGIRAVEQALDYGVKVFGVTVHFVDEGIDSGPIILQQAIELPEADRGGRGARRAAADRARVVDRSGAADRQRDRPPGSIPPAARTGRRNAVDVGSRYRPRLDGGDGPAG